MKKRLLALFLALVMAVVLLPTAALAADATSGTCGENATWTLSNGTLTISGTGAMKQYSSSAQNRAPWYENSKVTSVVINSGITTVGWGAFMNCPGLTSVVIPNSVTSIEGRAFQDCSNLNSVNIPNSVTKIGSYTFLNCASLTSVTIPDSVTQIDEFAFSGCTSLTEAPIPASVTKLGDAPFPNCTSMTAIEVDSKNPNYVSVDGVLFNKSKDVLLQYPCGKQGAYSVPDSVTTIKNSAFSSCVGLTSVSISNSVTSIENFAFSGCTNLASVTLSNSVTSLGSRIFEKCTNLTSVTIPKGVASIGDRMFVRSGLTSIVIPDSVTSIDAYAFSECNSLTGVTIPTSVTEIKYGAFLSCPQLKDAYYTGTQAQWDAITIEDANESLLKAYFHDNSTGSTEEQKPEPPKPVEDQLVYDVEVPLTIGDNNTSRVTFDFNWFTVSPTAYNHELARFSVAMSNSAYRKDDFAGTTEVLRDLGFVSPRRYDVIPSKDNWLGGGTVGYEIAYRTLTLNGERTTVVAVVIRGTANIEEWASNVLNSGMVDMDSGFDDASKTIIRNVNDCVSKIGNPGTIKFFVTGHSRGAVVANLVAAELSSKKVYKTVHRAYGTDNVYCYTFASPLLIKEDAGLASCPNIYNIVNPNDPVPLLPPFGKARYGTTLYLPNKKTYIPARNNGKSFLMFRSKMEEAYARYAQTKFIEYSIDPNKVSDTILARHGTEVYYAWMSEYSAEELFGRENSRSRSTFKKLTTACPVDVYVYDKDGTLLASVVNEKIETDILDVEVKDGVKTICVPVEMEYDIRIVAREDGTVNYTVSEMMLGDTGETATRTVGFDEITIEKDDVITGKVDGTIATPASNYDLTKTSTDGTKTVITHSSDDLEKPTVTFSDVPSNEWYSNAVYWAVENSITVGTTATTFSPNQNCTEIQILTFLWRAAGKPAANVTLPVSVTGVDDYISAAKWAYSKGMIDATFKQDTPCTRAGAVKFMWQAAGSPTASNNSGFTDVPVSADYAQAVTWAVGKDVANGTGNNTFSPNNICSRAHIVTFLYRDRTGKS